MRTRYYNKAYFTTPTIENCYWGGFLAADGCVSLKHNSVTLGLAEKDIDHLTRFKDVIAYDGKLLYRSKTKSFHLQLYAAEQWLYDLENTFNVVPNKSLSLKPPYGLMHCGRDFEKAYLVGLIDGDGCIRYDKRDGLLHLDVFSGSLRLVRWAKELLESEFALPDKKIFAGKSGRAFLYRLIGRSAETVRAGLAAHCASSLQRKWDPVRPTITPKDRRKRDAAGELLHPNHRGGRGPMYANAGGIRVEL